MNSIILSDEQQFVFDKFRRGENIFLTGQAGTGKTEIIKQMVGFLTGNLTPFKVCALTGCAAILLGCKAVTLHSFAGIGLCVGESARIVNQVLGKKKKVSDWREVKVLIIDEVSMMSKKIFEIIERIARQTRFCNSPFGGIQIIMTGDFMQLPPVPTMGDVDSGMFCFESNFWRKVFPLENHIELKKVFRQRDPIYRQILTETRNGRLSPESTTILESRLNIPFNPEDHNGCIPTKIFATRVSVDHVNRVQYSRLKTTEYVFNYTNDSDRITYLETGQPISKNKLIECSKLSEEDIAFESKKLFDSSNFQQILRLKVGTIVMCVANIDMDNEICNGSQGIVLSFNQRITTDDTLYPFVKFHNGFTKLIVPYFRQGEEFPSISVGQVPLVPAWAISIHKCQGATMDIAEIDIGRSIFEFGQSYVALSRVKSLEGLYLSGFDESRIKTHQKVIDFYSEFIDIRIMINDEIAKKESTHPKIQETTSNSSLTASSSRFFKVSKLPTSFEENELDCQKNEELDFEKYQFVPTTEPITQSSVQSSVKKIKLNTTKII